MGHPQTAGHAGRGREDRLSKLGDGVLGHILSFLGTKEAARAAALSSRWRDIFASVHTVSLEEPEKPIPDYDSNGGYYDPNPPPLFTRVVTTALSARSSRPFPNAASVPLRALRVAMESYGGGDASTVDHWVSRALKHAAPELQVHLRLRRVPVCRRPDPIHDAAGSDEDHAASSDEDVGGKKKTPIATEAIDDNDDVASSADESAPQYWQLPPALYTVPRQLFSSTALRSLCLGSCRLCPPATISLPALRALHLTHAPDAEEHVQRLISACTLLADLTLEACATVTTLSLLDNTRLCGLTLRCCHKLHTVTIDPSELQSLEYRGGVPGNSFLTVPGDGGFPSITSCKLDICAVCVDEASSPEQHTMLGSFLQQFTLGKHLHLSSTRMGSCFVELPAFPSLRCLQLNGRALHNDPGPVVVASTNTILKGAPNLERLTLFFEPPPPETYHDEGQHYFRDRKRVELLDAHHLHYNQYDSLDNALPASVPIAPCLRSRMRRIDLVHYQGGRAQRMLAMFLLRNALLLEKLYCEFAQGPMWIQTELMREMESWVVNDTARKVFH